CGYVAGIRAAQLGMKVCVIEKDKIGGVCLNSGCIPTKSLSASSKALEQIACANEFGINVKDYSVDFKKVYERKDSVVKKLSTGIGMLMKARKIDIVMREAEIKNPTSIAVGSTEIETKNILIATGSQPVQIPGMEFDGKTIVSSKDLLQLDAIPKSIIIVGGGVIGCEFASIFRSFGCEITIVEMLDQILPNEDPEVSRKLHQTLRKKGVNIFIKTKVEKIEKIDFSVSARLSDGKTISGEKVLISVGRAPNTKGLGIEKLGIVCDKGWIKVDKAFRTNIKNIYAAGDVRGGILLAHVASREGTVAVENMSGKASKIDYKVIPNCIFTNPEVASVGITDKQAKRDALEVTTRKFMFSAIGKAHVIGETDGFIKIVVEKSTDKILGAQIIGPHATELIAEFSPCIQFGIKSESLASVIHAHPTLSEIIQEVSEAVHNKAIHTI
ncbi:MAG: dihydrolipoyl dehydrogenase, partial [Candidatus Omnitrophota bacterium]|nr:dihydrolipoyl dehydrogenase [Candidatus Omnitrophota bacterium]